MDPAQSVLINSSAQVDASRIHIKDLRLRTYVGFNKEEQEKRQDVVINIIIDYDALKAAQSDHPDDALNYKTITKQVIELVENNRFLLLEKLVHDILALALAHKAANVVEVEVDKPHALRFSDSVSLTMRGRRGDS
ncbi:D-erythro-7,8-dihydroneopterin triphosphate epimerase [Natronocella acetinitrilica]|jgi:D-erythro-7,8-dihydroneopterin triphosphate epimerase|uniref:Dihydroneopterin triphosphate 2'-epimerase n=1 Tax=Natronocella acetinitrilica TaxID=414046 RepID=A0AAE3G468_9GAMM|nr:dihydroneopterin triphosphate 2'-epimerase [Natronocella acetinitrilica]MCP1674053.1 D-erythro-7,8-dihydroneopterin triphosphate epimerase [Natronocella acetinitrilica]